MIWCCLAFKERFEVAGLRGFAVFVSTRDDSVPAFIFQHRSLDQGASLTQTNVPLSLFADAQIHYCPWCGVKLAKHYKDSYQELERSDLKV
jgi:hypothetical protein